MTTKQQRNKAQQAAVKTVGGRAKYFACAKTKQAQSYGVWAVSAFANRGCKVGLSGQRIWL
jgi:hypothetical protein